MKHPGLLVSAVATVLFVVSLLRLSGIDPLIAFALSREISPVDLGYHVIFSSGPGVFFGFASGSALGKARSRSLELSAETLLSFAGVLWMGILVPWVLVAIFLILFFLFLWTATESTASWDPTVSQYLVLGFMYLALVALASPPFPVEEITLTTGPPFAASVLNTGSELVYTIPLDSQIFRVPSEELMERRICRVDKSVAFKSFRELMVDDLPPCPRP